MLLTDVWQVENLRFSFFFDISERNTWTDMWKRIAGKDAETRTDKPASFHTVDEGEWNGQKLSVVLQPDRLDIFLQPKEIELELPNAGKFSDVVGPFAETVAHSLSAEHLRSVWRAGFGAVLLRPAKDHEEAYVFLAEKLPAIKIDPQSKDFFYQINRPVASKCDDGVTVNRISKWSSVIAHFVSLGTGSNSTINYFANRVELDINSSEETKYGENRLLSGEALSEFVEYGKAIAEKGDQYDS